MFQNKAFFERKLGIFEFGKILQVNKFEGVDFKFDNSLLNVLPENTDIKLFWSDI